MLAPQQWTISEVSAWLESIELGELRETFAENSISGAELLELGEDDMKTLGVSKLGHRKKLLRRIAGLRGDANITDSSSTHAGSVNSSSAAESSENHDDPRTYSSRIHTSVLYEFVALAASYIPHREQKCGLFLFGIGATRAFCPCPGRTLFFFFFFAFF